LNREHKKTSKFRWIIKLFFIATGAVLMGIALELFLVPNAVIDGGIAGVSIISSHLSEVPLGVFLFVLNLPFLLLGYKQLGKSFVILTLYGITIMSITTALLHHTQPFTTDQLLAVLFGGLILGVGVGLAIRFGGALDGTEIIAILLANKLRIPVGQIVMFINVFIFIAAGFVFNWNSAMYSVFAYFIAFKAIDIVVEGLNESRSVTIISQDYEEIAQAIMQRLGRTCTFIQAQGGYNRQETQMLFCVVTRLELSKLKSIVQDIDPAAFMTIEDVADVYGGGFDKKAIH